MEALSMSDVVVLVMLLAIVASRVMKLAGWDRGAYIADELAGALRDAQGLIAAARDGGTVNLDRAAEAVAAQVKGVEAKDVRPIIESLASRAADDRYGLSVRLDSGGNVSVDPSGLAAKAVYKAGKWLKKIF